MKPLTFTVIGTPVGKGSMKAFMPKGGRFPIMTNDSAKSKPWASLISMTATQAAENKWPLLIMGPVSVKLTFVLPRPKGHYGTGKNASVLKPNAPFYHTSKPDIDKLTRLALDALTGILWKDDNQVADLVAVKRYATTPGLYATITEI